MSALWFHGLLSEAPDKVWMAIEVKARRPCKKSMPLNIVRCSGASLKLGLEVHSIDNVPVRVYSAAKTVADCFKYRGKIGLDLAVEMLNRAWWLEKVSMWELTNAAKVCRVLKSMEEYLDYLSEG
jgi:predicted transcriptional regulator of viral defense system